MSRLPHAFNLDDLVVLLPTAHGVAWLPYYSASRTTRHPVPLGTPQADIDTVTFPDLKKMAAYGENKNVSMGFYFDNCRCHEKGMPTHYPQDAQLTEDLG
jgi:hypothetical protein